HGIGVGAAIEFTLSEVLEESDEVVRELLDVLHLGGLRVKGLPVHRFPLLHAVEPVAEATNDGILDRFLRGAVVLADGEIGGHAYDLARLEMNNRAAAVARLKWRIDFHEVWPEP